MNTTPSPPTNRTQEEITAAASFVKPMKEEIGKVLVGQDRLVDGLLIALVTGGHVLVEGVPGLAKTLAVKTLANVLDCQFSRLQFTPDLLPADLLGTSIYDPRDHSFSVKKGPIFAHLVLADEINRAPAKVQSALLEAMQEKQVTIGGETLPLPDPFLVMATQNPIEQEGTYPLPEAQVDRFMLKTLVSYPERDEEQQVLQRMAHPQIELTAKPVKDGLNNILSAREQVDRVYLDTKIENYILDLVLATRPITAHHQLSERQREFESDRLRNLVEFGASPRATLALALSSKAQAFLRGRAYVIPQDVKDIAPAVLRHRIIPTYEAEAEGMTNEHIVSFLLDQLRTP